MIYRSPSAEQADPTAPRAGPRRGPPIVSARTAMALRRALDAADDGPTRDDRLRRAARMVAADAHTHGVSADQMLTALEREWPSAVSARRLPRHGAARDFTGRLVTLCIHEFYAAGR